MTSGNLSGKPPAITNGMVRWTIYTILPDGFLLHNRDIVIKRMDDGRTHSGEMLRVVRGDTCRTRLVLPPGFRDVPPMLCLGADLENTFCLVRGEQAVVSQHLGDLVL